MAGAIAAAVFALQAAPDGSYTEQSRNIFVSVLLIPIAVQWWSVWYPSAEPGGGGYVAQRMLAAKNEKHARAAVLLFTALYYGLRPWPWIIVALCSIVVFPDIESIARAFPLAHASIVNDDLAYPAMLRQVLPEGWLGLVVASLLAAYISTISIHLNWGSSYLVNDFYLRFLRPAAGDREQVMVGRMATLLMMFSRGCSPCGCRMPCRASKSCCKSGPVPACCLSSAGSGGASTR